MHELLHRQLTPLLWWAAAQIFPLPSFRLFAVGVIGQDPIKLTKSSAAGLITEVIQSLEATWGRTTPRPDA